MRGGKLPSPQRSPAKVSWLLLAGLLGLGCQRAGSPPELVQIAGCDDVQEAADKSGALSYVCALNENEMEGRSQVWVRAESPGHGAVSGQWSQGDARAATLRQVDDGRILLDLPRAALPLTVSIRERSLAAVASADEPTLRIQLIKRNRFKAIADAIKALADKGPAAALQVLKPAATIEPYLSNPIAKAQLLHAQAYFELEGEKFADAIPHLEQALPLAEQAGLIQVVASDARHLAYEHFRRSYDIDKALSILEKYARPIQMIGIEEASALRDRGIFAQARGHLSDAVRLFAQAHAAALALGDEELRRKTWISEAVALQKQGLTRQAEAKIADILVEIEHPGSAWEGCDRMRALNTLGWTRVLAMEARKQGVADPRSLFTRALFYQLLDGCQAAGLDVHLNLGRAELLLAEQRAAALPPSSTAQDEELADHLRAVQARLDYVAALEPSDQLRMGMRQDIAELGARIAFLRGRYAEAAALFQQLVELAQKSEEPDYLNRGLIGQALSNAELARRAKVEEATRYTEAARTAFAAAQAWLDERMWEVPLTAARRAFLPRFEAGTAAFVDFLLEQNDVAEALAVARRARAHGLITTLAFDTLTTLPEPQRSRLMAKRAAFLSSSEKLQAQPATTARVGQRELAAQLESLLAELHKAGLGRVALHALQPGEVMHLCHPLPHDELACFAADQHEVLVARIRDAELKAATDGEKQAALLLRPFARLIDHAQVLRVIPSEKLRTVNFAALPWPGDSGYLSSTRRLVVYALDVDLGPRQATPPTARGRALMLTELGLGHAQLAAKEQYASLRELGWQVTPYSSQRFDRGRNLKRMLRCWLHLEACPPPLPLPVETYAGTAPAVKAGLATVELAQLDIHAAYGSDSGWQSFLRMPDGESVLTIADLLTLERVPRFTVLTVCEGATAGKGEDTDDISLAQALLLRGAEAVVAASQTLEDRVGARWSTAIYKSGGKSRGGARSAYMQASSANLIEAFRAAQTALREQSAPPSEWSAMGLFVP